MLVIGEEEAPVALLIDLEKGEGKTVSAPPVSVVSG
jgi:hypothetical protein